MPALTCSAARASAHSQSGSTTTYSSASSSSTWTGTTSREHSGPRGSAITAVSASLGEESGTVGPTSQTIRPKNMMKTAPFPSVTCPNAPHDPREMQNSRAAWMTSPSTQPKQGHPGNQQKMSHSAHLHCLQASPGTSMLARSRSRRARKRSTWPPYHLGNTNLVTCSLKPNGFSVSYYTLASLFPPEEPTSQNWRPCSPSSAIVLTCHTPHLVIAQLTSDGGLPPYANTPSVASSQAHAKSSIPMPTQMLAQAWASQFGSTAGGEHGASYLAGKLTTATLDGRKPLASNSSSSPSPNLSSPDQHLMLRFTETIGALLKAGGEDAAVTAQPTACSNASTVSPSPHLAPSSLITFPAPLTQPTTHHAENTLLAPYFCPPLPIHSSIRDFVVDFNAPLRANESCRPYSDLSVHAPPKTRLRTIDAERALASTQLKRQGEELFKMTQAYLSD